MKKKTGKGKPDQRRNAAQPSRRPTVRLALAGLTLLAVLGAFAWWRTTQSAGEKYVPRPAGQLTFNKDVAPIIFDHCAGCHRPGQSAPFALLSYADVKKRATNIAEITARRLMPPWLPEPGFGEFAHSRRLSADQLGVIQQWVAEGATEGVAADLPPLPRWNSNWQLGEPDLVVPMPQPYELVAEGKDVYRNFVIPVPITEARYVRGVELRPGNPKIVHHAFIKVDRSGQSRRLDAADAEPGFSGMNTPAEMPDGHFLGWQPGRLPIMAPEGLAWRLNPGSDLVLETHLNPSGKPETLQASIGLYFTDRPPTNTCFKIMLTSFAVDIPAGATEHVVQDNYVLPVDVDVLAVLPHAHYLAREMQGWATLPDGTRQWLLWIKQWDFNWQGDYRYARPVSLPKGTSLSMRFTYDNSTNNVRNPNHPPRNVTYGPQSRDEMAELWFQLLPHSRADLAALSEDYQLKMTQVFIESDEHALRKDPTDANAHDDLGMMLKNLHRLAEAEQQFRAAIQVKPDFALAHYDYGVLLREFGRLPEAKAELETALRLDPKNSKAHGNLGFIFLQEKNLAAAQSHFESALKLNPDDALARAGLDEAIKGPGLPRR